MLEKIHGVPQRIASLKAKLKAREGKAEYKENCEALKREITRLESVSANREALEEFARDEAVASGDDQEKVT